MTSVIRTDIVCFLPITDQQNIFTFFHGFWSVLAHTFLFVTHFWVMSKEPKQPHIPL